MEKVELAAREGEYPCHGICAECQQKGCEIKSWEYEAFIDEGKLPFVKKYPPVLQKACIDHFEYRVVLSGGMIVDFEDVSPIDDKWVHLNGCRYSLPGFQGDKALSRGMDIKISQIISVIDAPYGT